MSRVTFMCCPSGSGKSTYAKRLESEGMALLSFDVEMWRRGISAVPPPREVRDEIEAALRAPRLMELVGARADAAAARPRRLSENQCGSTKRDER